MNAVATEAKRDTLTVKGITEAIGGVQRTVQYWADTGVLQADPSSEGKGKGVSRQFPLCEVAFAEIAQRLTETHSPIGEILAIVKKLRSISVRGVQDRFGEMIQLLEQEGDGPERRKVADLAQSALEAALIWNPEVTGAVYMVVVYDKEQATEEPAVRFWFSDLEGSETPFGSLVGYVDMFHTPGSSFKAISVDREFGRQLRSFAGLGNSKASEQRELSEFAIGSVNRIMQALTQKEHA